ncbi:uncharacterized protein ycf45 [Amborella trichopoda]|uniref:AAA+ ATPase domain-containing protein n=1 Tax=Amborella trichopoda TaxID=13333 RepID=W1P028_AMBTC|nr:uncharacterized protein ycf45 [Amborella trichopoda]ERN01283.1 hypothetical protein AMTR_s00002p00251390 [Amborella trichopoda]|eukprot:XP_006838714.1 uncharacterized protein ycf45 [Amborella trichopoda]
MNAIGSCQLLLDLQSSWRSINQIPISAFAYLYNNNAKLSASSSPSPSSSPFKSRRGRRGIGSSNAFSLSPQTIRKPFERFSVSPLTTSSRLGSVSELMLFMEIVPLRMRRELLQHSEIHQLIEVVIDLGRKPLARFPSGDWVISQQPVELEDLKYSISKVGDFSDDNRSGINNSLHRISAIRNRKMQIIGLTCRVGRAISGSAEMVRDLVEDGGSVLVIGQPGVGKTTLIREIARMLADDHKRRVVIIDTSNEIGGDGDIPHSGIGRARRMQVPNVNMQHTVMIEAVENHMPETIIIDEIGTELEAMAASTIAQRGVQLVGTAHGMTIENIMRNPSLQILVGGIESVTLGDDEAKKRKVQKTILERKGPSTFLSAVEMISRTECRVHHRLDATVDAILAGKSPLFEVRRMSPKVDGPINSPVISKDPDTSHYERYAFASDEDDSDTQDSTEYAGQSNKGSISAYERDSGAPVRLYTCKILEADLLQVIKFMGLDHAIDITDDIGTANAILALKSELKQNPWIRGVAKFHQLPIFVIKANTMAQMVKAIRMILGMDTFGTVSRWSFKQPKRDIEIADDAPQRKPSLEEIDALEEVRLAIEYIVIPGGEPVELLPRCSKIIARQLALVESYQLAAERSGTELNSRLQILPMKIDRKNNAPHKNPGLGLKQGAEESMLDWNSISSGGGGTSVARLPLLPEW